MENPTCLNDMVAIMAKEGQQSLVDNWAGWKMPYYVWEIFRPYATREERKRFGQMAWLEYEYMYDALYEFESYLHDLLPQGEEFWFGCHEHDGSWGMWELEKEEEEDDGYSY